MPVFHSDIIILKILKYFCAVCLLLSMVHCTGTKRSLTEPGTGGYEDDLSSVKIQRDRAIALENELIGLNPRSDGTEAKRLAETALQASAHLAEKYRLVRPPHLHNIFVQIGLRERGLCYHWTADLMHYLKNLQLRSFELRWGVAYRGSDLREHNTVVITSDGQSFSNGLVLDPWRHSGRLYWVVVADDTYPWHELPAEEW